MSQPTARLTDMAPAGTCDEDRGEFWISNPWKVMGTKRNLSAYEPNQVFLNLGNSEFANISYLTTADSDGDGRGVAVADITGDLQPDLLVRQSGGGPLQVYENRFPRTNRLEISLRGTKSNRLGIGARVVVEVGGRKLVRQLFPTNNFVVTQASCVRFGLGDAKSVERVTVHWPSGRVQQFDNVPVNAHVRLEEGADRVDVLVRGKGVQ